MNKSVEWLVLVGVLSIYIFARSRHLVWWERSAAALLSAGMAYTLAEEAAAYAGVGVNLATIIIMILGPMLLNGILTLGKNEDFIKDTMEAWVNKRLGLKGRDDE
jgi:hypothetical protein